MRRKEDRVTVFTVGHSNHPIEDFITILRINDIIKLVDIRSIPYSRFCPHFNRKKLKSKLAEEGIEYIYFGDRLGGKGSPLLKGLAKVDWEIIREQDWFGQALKDLVEIAKHAPTAIMCSEADPNKCHRHHLVGRSLHEMGIRVVHILKDGSRMDARFEAGPKQTRLLSG